MTYSIIQPPFSLKFDEMPKKELKDYFVWFQDNLPYRISELTQAVRRTPGFEVWDANFASSSLDMLGEWFALQVEFRTRTEKELSEIEARSSIPIEIPKTELTNRTFSLAMDIAMYLSQVFLKNYPVLRWDQQFGSKKNADYGQPVLVGFGSAPLNPVWIMVTLAYGIANKNKNGKRLRELYDYWASSIKM